MVYEVVLDINAINAASVDSQQLLAGHTDTNLQRITINPQQGPDTMARTVLHEALHVCWDQVGLDATLGDSDIQEKVIRALETPLLELLRRNRKLVEYLCQ